jgi:hypothetical protein
LPQQDRPIALAPAITPVPVPVPVPAPALKSMVALVKRVDSALGYRRVHGGSHLNAWQRGHTAVAPTTPAPAPVAMDALARQVNSALSIRRGQHSSLVRPLQSVHASVTPARPESTVTPARPESTAAIARRTNDVWFHQANARRALGLPLSNDSARSGIGLALS